ncbi:hypothetical protein BZA05DRAFT_382922 [Tricharina praecox]|uniref:uncharacterized protein n=1 Tax=Tricharina praecox TaxID=43433 RepID=UPI00221F3455|nr:uncharacterized protein BZA05DRAFT_382922 [Tricharina praecox]KAI5858954.1 hypothetical protein BZA05DRAFT_382922 [Tricharina praecox]
MYKVVLASCLLPLAFTKHLPALSPSFLHRVYSSRYTSSRYNAMHHLQLAIVHDPSPLPRRPSRVAPPRGPRKRTPLPILAICVL